MMTPETRATIYAVAARAGVSTATVSRALRNSAHVSEQTRQRVRDAMAELAYIPNSAAAALASKRQAVLGVVLPHMDGPYYAELLVGFEVAAGRLGYAVIVLLADPRDDPRSAVRALAERVDGVAFMACSPVGHRLVQDVAGSRAVVTVARGEVDGVEAITAENLVAAQTLTGHLLDTGRRRLRFVGNTEPGSDLGLRLDGFRQAHLCRGLRPAEPLPAELTERAGAAMAARLLRADQLPDGIVCANDLLAVSILHGLRDGGVDIPEHVAVTGWDDIHAAKYLTPALTTVSQPVTSLGGFAVDRLDALIRGDSSRVARPPLTTHIVYRASCCTGGHPLTTPSFPYPPREDMT